MELQPILHVWINHDNDLVDLTLKTSNDRGTNSSKKTQTSEVLHTNQRHPFLTQEKGFLPVSKLQLGMHILRANGSVGVVANLKVVPGAMTMYNLEVAQDHTFTVGDGQWVVHNCGQLFTNKLSQFLEDEIATANSLGVKPLEVGTAGFDEAINSGTVKWAVTKEGSLFVIQKFVGGVEISHAVLSGGESVLAAGEAEIAGSKGEYYLLDINNHSGHFEPGPGTENIGRDLFRKLFGF
jgi:hypothetical protein